MTRKPDRVRRTIEELLAELEEQSDRSIRDLRRLWREFLGGRRGAVVVGMVAIVLSSITTYGFTLTWRFLVDHVLLPPETAVLPDMAARERGVLVFFSINMGIWTVYLISLFVRGRILTHTGQDVVLRLRVRLHEKLQALHVGFYDQTPTGRIMSRVLDDITNVQLFVTSYFVTLVQSVVQLVAGMGILLYVHHGLAWRILVVLPFYGLTYSLFRPMILRASTALSRQNAKMYSLAAERVSGIRVVQAFGGERRELRSFARLMHDYMRMAIRQLTYRQGLTITAGLISAFATGGLLYACVLRVKSGAMTLGDVVAFVGALGNVFAPIANLTSFGSLMQTTNVSLRRIFHLLDAEEDVAAGVVPLARARGDVAFENVTFTYPGQSDPALRDVSFRVKPGEHIAIMGPSGSGKSTVFALLLRFYDPDRGRVEIGGVDIRKADPRDVRRHVCMVQQEPTIFSGTITENIMYGHLEATPTKVINAARQAELHEFIMSLPGKYETEVGESGVTLSGGQKQRVALATALLTDPEILLLDDTTSALDAATEGKIRATLRTVLADRSSLIITQRVATARSCDRILVFEGGRVTRIATHDELAAAPGFYRSVCERQGAC